MIQEVTLKWHDFKGLLLECTEVALDTETNAEDIRDGRGYGIGISLSARIGKSYFGCYLPFRHPSDNLDAEVQDDVRKTIEGYTGKFIFHNAKFDLVSLSTFGISWGGYFYDTMLMCHLINENFPYEKSLDSCVKAYVDKAESKKNDDRFEAWKSLLGWGGIPADEMAPYAIHDAVITLALYYAIVDKFYEDVPEEYWQHKQSFTRVIIAMESRGVRIDKELCHKMTRWGEEVMADLTQTIGGNIGSTTFLGKLLINQLKLPVVKLTPAGKPSFDKYAMEEYDEMLERVDNPLATYIMAYRGWQKSVSSNYRAYVDLISPDGRLRPNYKLHGTKTGRMSCEKPNLQQIPRVSDKEWNGQMKQCFVSSPGHTLFEADYSQLELRLGTAYSHEHSLIAVFDEGRDIFDEMSGALGLTRYWTKQFVYSVQYGAGNKRIANVFGVSLEDAQRMRDNYKNAYPGFARMSQQASAICKAKGKIKLWSGRYRHFKSKTEDSHKAFNSVIQGGSADIVEHQMVRLFNEVDGPDCKMLLQVHDSVVFEIKDDKVEHYKEKILSIMADIQPDFGVKFAVDFHHWGD